MKVLGKLKLRVVMLGSKIGGALKVLVKNSSVVCARGLYDGVFVSCLMSGYKTLILLIPDKLKENELRSRTYCSKKYENIERVKLQKVSNVKKWFKDSWKKTFEGDFVM